MAEKQHPTTVAEAVDTLHANMSLNNEILLATTNEDYLIDAYFALGHQIRHEYGLWTDNDALLESCRIISKNKDLHVDDASMVIVKALWVKVREKTFLTKSDTEHSRMRNILAYLRIT